MNQLTQYILLALILLVVTATACKKAEQPKPVKTSQVGQCPKIEGSYFGADRSSIKPGEVVNLEWKIPHAYGKTMEIEGLMPGEPPTIRSFTAAPSYSPIIPPDQPEFDTGRLPVKPDKSLTFTLKATGPEGCPPLELPAKVMVE